MDTPYYGTSIAGGKEQVVKPGSTVTLTCKSVIIGQKPDDFDNDDDTVTVEGGSGKAQSPVKNVSWYKDNNHLSDKVG